MPDIFKKLFRFWRKKPISKIIADEIRQLPIGSLSTDEKVHIKAAQKEIHDSSIEMIAGFESSIEIKLEQIWYPEKAAERQRIARKRIAEKEASYGISEDGRITTSPQYSCSCHIVDPDWYIAFTPDFTKSLKHVDRKLQGRILTAITHLTESPLKPVGDTVEPLSANLSGLWRYRIGDHRLIYRPDQYSKRIYLLSFAPRGGVYDA